MSDETIQIELTHAEAVVLFEWLTRNDNANALAFDDDAEQQVLWALEAALEKRLVEPLAHNYAELLERARKDVRDKA